MRSLRISTSYIAIAVGAMTTMAVLPGPNGMVFAASADDAAPAAAAPAADSPPANSAQGTSQGSLAEVIVTAEKRRVNEQKVPIAVEVINSDSLKNVGADTAQDLSAVVTGLVLPKQFAGGLPYMRGLGNITGTGGENAVAFYVDGIYLSSPTANLLSFNNIDRVEVLKGPQGTLFGRNADGGLIQVITRDPSQDTHLDASAGYGSYNDFVGNLYVTGGVTDNLATNFAFYGEDRLDGWGHNVTTGATLFTARNLGLQNKWIWGQGPWKITANLIYASNKGAEGSSVGLVPGTTTPGGAFKNVGYNNTASPVNPNSYAYHYIDSLKEEYQFNWGKLTNLSAYTYTSAAQTYDLLGFPTVASPTVVTNPQYSIATDQTYSNEFQVQALPDSKLQWIGGLFYLHDSVAAHLYSWGTYEGVGVYPGLSAQLFGGDVLNSYAAYAQGTYPILPSTRLTFGIRYSDDDKDLNGTRYLYNAAGANIAIQTPATFANASPRVVPKEEWNKVTYRVSLDHDLTDNLMGYLAYNTGFKGGMFSVTNVASPAAAPETVSSYSAGFKSEFFDHRFRLNAEGFYMVYDNIQLRTNVATPGTTSVTIDTYNAASANISGLDADLQARLAKSVSLYGGMEYLHAYYDKFPNSPCFGPGPTGGIVSLGLCNESGTVMIRSPKFTGNLGIQYLLPPLPSGADVSINVADAYNSGFFWDPDHLVAQHAYQNLTASIRWTSASGSTYIRVWGKNLTNAHIWANGGENTLVETYYPGEPLMVGVEAGYHF